MSTSTETLIVSSLIKNEAFLRAAIPHLKEDYFDAAHQVLFRLVKDFWDKYSTLPTVEALGIELENGKANEHEYTIATELLNELSVPKEAPDDQWLLDTTEQFCKDKAMFNALKESIAIIQGEDDRRDKGAIPGIMTDALAVSFDTQLGHDYLDDAEERFEARQQKVAKVPFDIEQLNKATNGGAERKTLNVLLAGTNVGKSLGLCHLSAAYLQAGYNVLYITLEMADKKIADRLDANILDITLDDLLTLPKPTFMRAINLLKAKKTGRLKVKEYPTSGAHVGHFLYHVKELKTKEGFVPDIIVVDYINICASSRVKLGQTGSYGYVKAIAEELRGFFQQTNVVGWTATQVTRSGFNNSDVDLTDTAESWGLPQTADLFIGIVTDEELDKLNAFQFVLLKSRYSNKNKHKKFLVGVDRDKQKLYEISQPSGYGVTAAPTTGTASNAPPTPVQGRASSGKTYENIIV